MGKPNKTTKDKDKDKQKHKHNHKPIKVWPLVSICTPTHNRRPFLPWLLKCIMAQTYPLNKLEWIVLDDGTDGVGDLFTEDARSLIPFPVHYVYQPVRQTIGQKRNAMHAWCNGSIIVCMDDDDYYPPDRVRHAVTQLLLNPTILLAGCSEMHMFLHSDRQVYQSGPYTDKRPNHGTAATFAYTKELLSRTHYGEDGEFGEEKVFCQDYSIPMIQLNSLSTIVVINHTQNTIDKSQFVQLSARVKPSPYPIEHLIADPIMRQFYCQDVLTLLSDYPFQRPREVQVASQVVYDKMNAERQDRQRVQSQVQTKGQDARTYSQAEVDQIRAEHDKKMEEKNVIISQLLSRLHGTNNGTK